MKIESFMGQWRFLSNFHMVPIPYENVWYPSTEHAYQAAKSLDPQDRENIRKAAKPGDAKKLGKKMKLRPGWDGMKLDVMGYIVWYKFMMYPDLGQKLLDTGEAELIEGNTWGDTFWGVCDGKGENWLGQILMGVREQLRKHGAAESAPKTAPKDKVFEPGPGKVFVFGSNLSGVHGAGAALDAVTKYGAIPGIGEGPMPNCDSPTCYGIPTKDQNIETLPLDAIKTHVLKFVFFAWERRDLTFFVTRIGCGLAGYTDEQVAPLFQDAPPNCDMPYGWESP
jgi:ribA/ribD-fused uncharacterized protein